MPTDPIIIQQIYYSQKNLNVKVGVSKRRTPTWLHPDRWQREYQLRLLKYVDELEELYKRVIDNRLDPSLFERDRDLNIRTDNWVDDINNFSNEFNIDLDRTRPETMLAILRDIPEGTNQFNRAQWQRIIKAKLGVEIFQNEPFLVPLVQSWTQENVTLITSMTDDLKKNINITVRRGFINGRRHEEISKNIQKTFNVTRNRAKLIARDQVSKLNGDLSKFRQTNLGISQYTWEDSDDTRVRSTHAAHDGKIFKWSESPANTGHPGEDYQCRCWANPDFGEIDEELRAYDRHVSAELRPTLSTIGVR